MSGAERTDPPQREYAIEPGGDQDVCPLCGIWRKNAGWIKESCGPDFREPGCFVAPEDPGSHD